MIQRRQHENTLKYITIQQAQRWYNTIDECWDRKKKKHKYKITNTKLSGEHKAANRTLTRHTIMLMSLNLREVTVNAKTEVILHTSIEWHNNVIMGFKKAIVFLINYTYDFYSLDQKTNHERYIDMYIAFIWLKSIKIGVVLLPWYCLSTGFMNFFFQIICALL